MAKRKPFISDAVVSWLASVFMYLGIVLAAGLVTLVALDLTGLWPDLWQGIHPSP
jgi:hypothetical protein